jgi:hypothetical protein
MQARAGEFRCVICAEARELARELACDRVKKAALLLEAMQLKKMPEPADPPSRSWLNGALEAIGLRRCGAHGGGGAATCVR